MSIWIPWFTSCCKLFPCDICLNVISGSFSSAWRKENSWVQFLIILLSSWILWLPFINTCRAHKLLQMRNRRKRRIKMEGGRKKLRNLRLQMDLNLWLCEINFCQSTSISHICSDPILNHSNTYILNTKYSPINVIFSPFDN